LYNPLKQKEKKKKIPSVIVTSRLLLDSVSFFKSQILIMLKGDILNIQVMQ